MKNPKIIMIGKNVIVEFETYEESEEFYTSLKLATKLVKALQENADQAR